MLRRSLRSVDELQDDVLLSVYDNCIEIASPTVNGSSCGETLVVGVSVVGRAGATWAYGRLAFGDEVEDRFVELEGLRGFAIPYQANADLWPRMPTARSCTSSGSHP